MDSRRNPSFVKAEKCGHKKKHGITNKRNVSTGTKMKEYTFQALRIYEAETEEEARHQLQEDLLDINFEMIEENEVK